MLALGSAEGVFVFVPRVNPLFIFIFYFVCVIYCSSQSSRRVLSCRDAGGKSVYRNEQNEGVFASGRGGSNSRFENQCFDLV